MTRGRLILAALAVCWFLLGFASTRVPLLNRNVWVVLCSLSAGAALAAMRWRTVTAIRSYCVIACAVGGLRSVAYLTVGSYSPMFAWLIVAVSTTGVYHLFILYRQETTTS